MEGDGERVSTRAPGVSSGTGQPGPFSSGGRRSMEDEEIVMLVEGQDDDGRGEGDLGGDGLQGDEEVELLHPADGDSLSQEFHLPFATASTSSAAGGGGGGGGGGGLVTVWNQEDLFGFTVQEEGEDEEEGSLYEPSSSSEMGSSAAASSAETSRAPSRLEEGEREMLLREAEEDEEDEGDIPVSYYNALILNQVGQIMSTKFWARLRLIN